MVGASAPSSYLLVMKNPVPAMKILRVLATAGLIICSEGYGAEQLGPLHPIVEPDMLQEIYRVLNEKEKSGETARLQKEAIERSKKSIENPPLVSGLKKVEKARHFYWDPTVTVAKTIHDPQGNVIAEAGQKVNPLDYVPMTRHLLFFDGRDPTQVAKAVALIKHYKGLVKPILTGGQPLSLSREWKTQVFYDQGGALVRKLGITKVPSLVTQEGKKLRIDELEAL